MFYLYVSEKGKLIEVSYPIGKAPEEVVVEGKRYKRDHEGEFSSQQFSLKGSGWPTQDLKRKTQMTRNNVEAGNRTQKTWGKPKGCVPNYKGEEVESWREVKSLAKKDRKNA